MSLVSLVQQSPRLATLALGSVFISMDGLLLTKQAQGYIASHFNVHGENLPARGKKLAGQVSSRLCWSGIRANHVPGILESQRSRFDKCHEHNSPDCAVMYRAAMFVLNGLNYYWFYTIINVAFSKGGKNKITDLPDYLNQNGNSVQKKDDIDPKKNHDACGQILIKFRASYCRRRFKIVTGFFYHAVLLLFCVV
eukprot:jgi/Picre1/27897/NNA_000860.t1